jgi:hypothetical protein
MADKVLDRKKHRRIHAQTEKFYEEIRKKQQNNISGPRRRTLGTDSRYGEEIGHGDW